jgi:cytochrome c553
MVHPRRQPRRAISAAFAGMVICWFTAGSAGAAEAPPGASACSGCHPASTAVPTPVPLLAGLPTAHIVTAMQAFRTGQRPATVMDRIAKGFSDAEIAAIAAWYAGQKR